MPSSIESVQTAVAGIVKDGKKYLVVKSNRWHGKLAIPGGKIDRGESAFDAIQREMMEETGLNIVASDLVYVDGPISSADYIDPGAMFLVSVFRCYAENIVIVLNDEASGYEWLTKDELKARSVTDWTLTAINHAEDKSITRHGYLPHMISKKILIADVDDFVNPAILEATREMLGRPMGIHDVRKLSATTLAVAEKLALQKYVGLVGPSQEEIGFMKMKAKEGYAIIMLCDIGDELQTRVRDNVMEELRDSLVVVVRDDVSDGSWKQKILKMAKDQDEIIVLEDSDEDLNLIMRSLPDKKVYAFILGKRRLDVS
ncbi:MAG: NUDIX domain-containing protein [Nitrososphaerota archaeon]|nr:NUDIX domain-containing protein [Nitrososphaerota archaeon]